MPRQKKSPPITQVEKPKKKVVSGPIKKRIAPVIRGEVGRPLSLTPAIQDLLVAAIRKGLTYEDACGAAGISYSAFHKWRNKAEQLQENGIDTAQARQFIQFLQAIKKAEAEVVEKRLKNIEDAATNEGQWQAAAWLLERRYPERWGRRTVDLNHRNITDEQIAKLTDEEIRTILSG